MYQLVGNALLGSPDRTDFARHREFLALYGTHAVTTTEMWTVVIFDQDPSVSQVITVEENKFSTRTMQIMVVSGPESESSFYVGSEPDRAVVCSG